MDLMCWSIESDKENNVGTGSKTEFCAQCEGCDSGKSEVRHKVVGANAKAETFLWISHQAEPVDIEMRSSVSLSGFN
jgi:hypothetical protein